MFPTDEGDTNLAQVIRKSTRASVRGPVLSAKYTAAPTVASAPSVLDATHE